MSAQRKRIIISSVVIILTGLLVIHGYAADKKPIEYVDPLLGTVNSRWMLSPGPSLPFGMVKLGPDTRGDCWFAGYDYRDNSIMGFSDLHDYLQRGFLIMPTVGDLLITTGRKESPDLGYRSRFSHDTETASPGYYAVTLEDYGVKAELTVTTRVGFHRYTFPETDDAHILIDLKWPVFGFYGEDEVLAGRVEKISATEIAGWNKSRSQWYAGVDEYTVHFVARFSKPFASFGTWSGEEVYSEDKPRSGKDIGAFVNYSTSEGEVILVKVGISRVSIEQARLNLETELPGWDFDAVRERARKIWNEALGKIEVEGGTEEQKIKFYTGLYRALFGRSIISDVDGKYVDMDEKVRQIEGDYPHYTSDAFWNTFWNLNPLWTLVYPKRMSGIIKWLLDFYDNGGWIPKGPVDNEYSSVMIASHAAPMIVGAWMKGIRDFDVEKAYAGIRKNQMVPGHYYADENYNEPSLGWDQAWRKMSGGHVGNFNLKSYMKFGYVPIDEVVDATAKTLEYAYDDWCVAQLARTLGKEDDYNLFMQRAHNYKNVFDPSVNAMRGKNSDGTWLEPYKPLSGKGFAEGISGWQYIWFVPHDVQGLINLMGGRDKFNEKLNWGFEQASGQDFRGGNNTYLYHGQQSDMQVGWLFNYSGKPWLTHKWVKEIMARAYGITPKDGYPGDEDQGQMGSWYVLSAMGIFEVDGGAGVEPVYEIGSPIFDKVTIRLDKRYYQAEKFVIIARDVSDENRYIQSATLDGKALNKPWFYHSELVDGGELILQMGPEPNEQWGSKPEDAPPSMTKK